MNYKKVFFVTITLPWLSVFTAKVTECDSSCVAG